MVTFPALHDFFDKTIPSCNALRLLHHGEEAFRPAYGKLGELRALLSKGTAFQALSATLPPHILSAVKNQLMVPPDHIYLALPPMMIPKTLVFHDNMQEAVDAAAYNDSCLPKQLQNQGIMKHYHSDMSAEYLQQTCDDFASVSGTCRIIHAMAGASTGLDIPGVMIVIQYGIPKNLSEALQHLWGLYLMMIETWALEVNLTEEHDDADDADKPYAITAPKKNSSKRDRTGCAALQYVQSKMCLREFFAKYFNDPTPTGSNFFSSLHYVTAKCCNRHPDSGFNLSTYFLGSMHSFNSASDRIDPSSTAPAKRKHN
ncbi:uncharacterized protein F5147DRAFT_651823 [Suillus discolor]|uniref:DNA 3'-5' helicase n=1 Tax=Suillus discolor TaxID=1912936 RepID=A0A9P7FAG9_9AGAM|nr:uncharacterized protein F5147DRAFT_651823 [Suillus discolor]KAG2110650.1 hypothetical protein F5147DRAFT_651823 [Suillus discolor]